ncbi:hypothetical protein BC938DRAFT_483719 [Jimgerdemannia flammicorona]|uniref:Nucleolus and neural progenitor protein-like N-terminal domain-containing protein n=1 Tax=Jimgerdemannia flammicorona TaxID=994334 RepID=A0A433QBD6_9FUNG|nr:hypothetical protein BC938DRAFT_483719 [Jimgerdemannia flammicorona]
MDLWMNTQTANCKPKNSAKVQKELTVPIVSPPSTGAESIEHITFNEAQREYCKCLPAFAQSLPGSGLVPRHCIWRNPCLVVWGSLPCPLTPLDFAQDHDPKLRRLTFLQKCFQKRNFWNEAAVLDRLYYKNKNQHRQAGYWWKLCEVRRLLNRLKEIDLSGLTSNLTRAFYGGKPLKKAKGPMETIPSREYLTYAMHRMVGAVLIMDKFPCASQANPIHAPRPPRYEHSKPTRNPHPCLDNRSRRVFRAVEGLAGDASTKSHDTPDYEGELPTSLVEARELFARHNQKLNGALSGTVAMTEPPPTLAPGWIATKTPQVMDVIGIDIELEDMGEPIELDQPDHIPPTVRSVNFPSDDVVDSEVVQQPKKTEEPKGSAGVVTTEIIMREATGDVPTLPATNLMVRVKKQNKEFNDGVVTPIPGQASRSVPPSLVKADSVPFSTTLQSANREAKRSKNTSSTLAPSSTSLARPDLLQSSSITPPTRTINNAVKKRVKDSRVSKLPPLSSLFPPSIVELETKKETQMVEEGKRAAKKIRVMAEESDERAVTKTGKGKGRVATKNNVEGFKNMKVAKPSSDEIDDIFGGF